MAKSIFSKQSIVPFLVFLAAGAVVSGSVGAYSSFYLSKDKVSANEIRADLTKLGKSFSVEEAMGEQLSAHPWIKNGNYSMSIFSNFLNEENEIEATETESFISFNKEKNKFEVVGIGTGKILFTNVIDSSVLFELPFTTSFNSLDTISLIKEQYSYMYDDKVLTQNEFDAIKKFKFNSNKSYDLFDMEFFKNLKSIVVNPKNSKLLEITNPESLPKDCYFYVGFNEYENYISRKEAIWTDLKNRIFIEEPGEGQINIILTKNGGSLGKDDNTYNIQSFLVNTNDSYDFLSKENILRTGYNFKGWNTLDNKIVVKDTTFDKNTKLSATWEAMKYSITFHLDPFNEFDVETVTYTYDVPSVLYKGDNPSKLNSKFIGWGLAEDSDEVAHSSLEVIENLIDLKDLYAIFIHSSLEIEFYKGAERLETISLNEGDSYTITEGLRNKAQDVALGAFSGWAFDENASKLDFDLKNPIDFFNVNILEPNIVKLYAFYTVDGPCTIKFYGEKGIGSGLEIAKVFSESGHLYKFPSLFDLETFYKEEYEKNYELKKGHRFVGWQDTETKIVYSPYKECIKEIDVLLTPNWEVDSESGLTFPLDEWNFKAYYTVNSFEITMQKRDNEKKVDEPIIYSAYYDQQFSAKYLGDVENHVTLELQILYEGHELTINPIPYSIVTSSQPKMAILSQEKINAIYSEILKIAEVNDDHFEDETRNVSLVRNDLKVFELHTLSYNVGKYDVDAPQSEPIYNGKTVMLSLSALAPSGYNFDYWELTCDKKTFNPAITYNKDQIKNGIAITYNEEYYNKGNITLVLHCSKKGPCISGTTSILMGDGTYKNAGELVTGDIVMSFNHLTGKIEPQPLIVNECADWDSDYRNVLTLTFENNKFIEMIDVHGYFDCTLNKYIYIYENDYEQYIGHEFAFYNYEADSIEKSKLVSVIIENKLVQCCSPTTMFNLNIISGDLISISGGIEGAFNFFEYDENLKYDEELMLQDIETYGLFTYDDFETYGVPEELFEILPFKYMKISIGKGLLTMDDIISYLNKFLSEFGEFGL